MRLKSKEFDDLRPNPSQNRITMERATKWDLEMLYPRLDVALAHHLAALPVMERIRTYNPDNLWAIRNQRTGCTVGMYALLMLNREGHRAMLNGNFDGIDPLTAHLAAPAAEVAAIHIWGVYAPGVAAAAFPIMSEKLSHPRYRSLDVFGNGTTEVGRKMLRTLGFKQVEGRKNPNLFIYRRRHS